MASVYSTRSQAGNGVFTTRHFKDKVLKVDTIITYNGKIINVEDLANGGDLAKITKQLGDAINEHTVKLNDFTTKLNNIKSLNTIQQGRLTNHEGRITTLESKDCLGEEITVKPYQGISDELATAMGVSKNEDFARNARELLTLYAPTIGATYELYMIDKPKIANHETRITTLENNGGPGGSSGDCLAENYTAKSFQMASDDLVALTHFPRDKEDTRTYKEWIEMFAETSCMNMEMYLIDKKNIDNHETRITTLDTKVTTLESKTTLDSTGSVTATGTNINTIKFENMTYKKILEGMLMKIAENEYDIEHLTADTAKLGFSTSNNMNWQLVYNKGERAMTIGLGMDKDKTIQSWMYRVTQLLWAICGILSTDNSTGYKFANVPDLSNLF